MVENNFQLWMDKNGYTDVGFYPRNTNAYGIVDMIDSASKAVEAFDKGDFSLYEDSIETFID